MTEIADDIVDALFEYAADFRILHVEFGEFGAPGRFELKRTTRQTAIMGRNLNLMGELIVLGAFLPMPEEQVFSHLLAQDRSIPMDMAKRAQAEDFLGKVKAYRRLGQAWSDDTSQCALPTWNALGTHGAALLSLRTLTSRNLDEFHTIVAFLTEVLNVDVTRV